MGNLSAGNETGKFFPGYNKYNIKYLRQHPLLSENTEVAKHIYKKRDSPYRTVS